MAPGDLQEVLAGLKRPSGVSAETERNLLVGLGQADDAAVYRLGPDLAIVPGCVRDHATRTPTTAVMIVEVAD